MGMDVHGRSGNYFRNNCWWWRPLWNFVANECKEVISEKDYERGSYNDGFLVDYEKCEVIVEKLQKLVEDGRVKEYEKLYQKHLDSLPEDDFDRHYPFSEENVIEFIDFVKESEGFEIW